MNKCLIGFSAALLLVFCMASMQQQNSGIYIKGGFGGEKKLIAEQNDQVTDWISFKSNGVAVFAVPASGIIPVNYGGTGTNNIAGLAATIGLVGTATNGIVGVINGGTGTNTLAGITTLGLSAGFTGTNDTTWFDPKGSALALTNGGANITGVVFTRTNGLLYTNNIVNGVIR